MYLYQSQVKTLQGKGCCRRLETHPHPPPDISALMGAACALLRTERFPTAIQVIFIIVLL